MLDNTNQLSRSYSAHLDRQHFAAAEREERIAEIRDAVTKAWLEGSTERLPTYGGDAEPLAQIVSDECCDHPDSPLPGMLLVVAAAARGEDARELANAIINRFALDHAKRVVRQE